MAAHDLRALTQAGLHGALRPTLGAEVNVVNAAIVAKDAEIEVTEKKDPDAGSYRNLVEVTVQGDKGSLTVSGTMLEGLAPRIAQIDGIDIDLKPARDMLCLTYEDAPGIIGKIGSVLGAAGNNIARMEVSRTGRGKLAMMVLTLDEPATPGNVEQMRAVVALKDACIITLP
jgi:D-3-phosphoglycerate dehydrogenase